MASRRCEGWWFASVEAYAADMAELLSDSDIEAGLAKLSSDWTLDGDTIRRSIEADTFAAGISLVDSVAAVADQRNHHPDIDIRWTTITFALSTHSEGGLTKNDLELAAEIDRLAG
jgi:4a-hydroxytetrahydrobiopterin dehydratase